MYDERKNRFSLRDIIIQILLLVLFVFILVWLFPTKNFLKEQNVVENDKIYTDYMTSMSTAAKDYFTTDKVPTKVGESVKLTLNEMLDKKLVLPIGGKTSCDLDKSYIEVTKMDVDYQLRVELSCEDYADYVVITLGCKDFCNLTCTTTPNTKPSTTKPTQQSTKKYTVTFDSNGGSSVAKQTVESGKKAFKPVNPTKDGYTFVEWTLNGKTYDFNKSVTSNITLVASWEKVETKPEVKPEVVKYTVTFNSNGGSAVSSQTVVSGAKATKPANPTKDGYTFVEWTLNGKTYDFNTAVTSNITLVASWKKVEVKPEVVKYTVTFNSNGGSAVSSQTVVSGAKATKPANPTRNGYTFVEWTLNGKTYDFNTAVTSNITLVASWKANVVTTVEYQYSKTTSTPYTYYTWSNWSNTIRVWEKNKKFTNTNTTEYKVVSSGLTAANGTVNVCSNSIVDTKDAKKEAVYAKYITNTTYKYSTWRVVEKEYFSEDTLQTYNTGDSKTATEKYEFLRTQYRTLCLGCAQKMYYVYTRYERTVTENTTKTCPSGYVENSTKTTCYKYTDNLTCKSYGSDYSLENGKCVKREKECRDIPNFTDFTDYQYRTRTTHTGYNTTTDYKWSTSNNDSNLISMGYRLTGTTR